MRRFHVIIALLSICSSCLAQSDMIIMRSGLEYQGQVALVRQDKTVFKENGGNQVELDNSDIYMIKYDKRGNVFFTETGERFTSNGNSGKVPGGTDAIYLIEGKEIFAYDITLDSEKVTYYPPTNKKIGFIQVSKKGNSSFSIPKSEVFLIKYADGTKDMITDFETLRKQKEAELLRQKTEEEAAKKEEWLKSFPKSATIITKREVVINAIVISDDGSVVEFKRTSMEKSPVFVMNRGDIQDVFYKD